MSCEVFFFNWSFLNIWKWSRVGVYFFKKMEPNYLKQWQTTKVFYFSMKLQQNKDQKSHICFRSFTVWQFKYSLEFISIISVVWLFLNKEI